MTNNVTCLYTSYFLSEMLCEMYRLDTPYWIDESGTYWDIEDVKLILSQWDDNHIINL